MVFPVDIPITPEPSAIVKRMQEHSKLLLAQDADTIYAMGERWIVMESALEAQITLLTMEIADMGELVTQQSIFKLRRYQALLTQMQTEMSAYNLWAADYVAQGQMRMGVIGVSHAAEAVNLALLQGGASGVGTFFDTLPISAIQLMIGNAGKGGPVYTLLQENYPTAVEKMTNILINNVAMGMSPMVTAKQMMAGMAGGVISRFDCGQN